MSTSAIITLRLRGLTLLVIGCLGLSGCVKSSSSQADPSQASDSSSSGDATASSGGAVSAPASAPAAPAPPREVSLTVRSNAYGATIQVKDSESGEEVASQMMPTGKLDASLKLPAGRTYDFFATFGDIVTGNAKQSIQTDGTEVSLNFSETQMNDIRKAAACMLNIPGGGFGSGFLLGDRQTLATAAHCVACRDVQELEIVFHPTEPKERKVVGARLIFFDSNQDVALLHLKEPVEDSRPYYWRTRDAKEEDRVIVLGNPGRGGQPDPMFHRSAQVKGLRPDEFFIDIELKPGYSGGPISLAGGMDAIGITSFKYGRARRYEDQGKSFAKSIDIAADAYEHWMSLTSDLQSAKLDREQQRYTQRYGYFMANQAATALWIDSLIYFISCSEVVQDYVVRMRIAVRQVSNPTPNRISRAQKDAHEEYIKIHGPKKAADVRERRTPKLMMGQYYSDVYEQALADEGLPETIKADLRKAHEHYTNIKEAAEKVVDPSGRSRRGKTLEEFILWVAEELEAVDELTDDVINATQDRLD